MKTIRTILSIAGVALTTLTFGQLLSQADGSILFYTVAYNSVNNRLEHRLDEYPERSCSGDQFEAPAAARTYFVPMETDIAVESWMTSDFNSGLYEDAVQLESWMTTPFESNYYEVELLIESWMLSPFESNYYEVEPFIESWMTKPFKSGDEVEVEEWMTTSWI